MRRLRDSQPARFTTPPFGRHTVLRQEALGGRFYFQYAILYCMREQLLNIPTPDEKTIYGKYTSAGPDTPLAIIGHGGGSDMEHPLMRGLAQSLPDSGFSTYRYNYYGYEADARDQVDCSLETNAEDIKILVEHFSDSEIFLVGHSYGGLAILLYLEAARNESHDDSVRGAVLLDPSHPDCNGFDTATYVEQEDIYLSRNGKGHVYGGKHVRHLSELKPDEYLDGYDTPTLILSAGDGILCDTNGEYADAMGSDTAMQTVEGADHNFAQPGNLDEVLAEVPAWMKERATLL